MYTYVDVSVSIGSATIWFRCDTPPRVVIEAQSAVPCTRARCRLPTMYNVRWADLRELLSQPAASTGTTRDTPNPAFRHLLIIFDMSEDKMNHHAFMLPDSSLRYFDTCSELGVRGPLAVPMVTICVRMMMIIAVIVLVIIEQRIIASPFTPPVT